MAGSAFGQLASCFSCGTSACKTRTDTRFVAGDVISITGFPSLSSSYAIHTFPIGLPSCPNGASLAVPTVVVFNIRDFSWHPERLFSFFIVFISLKNLVLFQFCFSYVNFKVLGLPFASHAKNVCKKNSTTKNNEEKVVKDFQVILHPTFIRVSGRKRHIFI